MMNKDKQSDVINVDGRQYIALEAYLALSAKFTDYLTICKDNLNSLSTNNLKISGGKLYGK